MANTTDQLCHHPLVAPLSLRMPVERRQRELVQHARLTRQLQGGVSRPLDSPGCVDHSSNPANGHTPHEHAPAKEIELIQCPSRISACGRYIGKSNCLSYCPWRHDRSQADIARLRQSACRHLRSLECWLPVFPLNHSPY